MASNDFLRPESQVSVLEVVKAAGLELRELRARHRAVTKRIRNLRIAVGALRQMKTRGISFRMVQASRTSRLDPAKDEANPILATRDIASLQNRDLRRACRIALLETTEPILLDEIYARILRRGSFFFSSADIAAWAIGKELNAMAAAGELHQVDAASKRRWQRISLIDEHDETLPS